MCVHEFPIASRQRDEYVFPISKGKYGFFCSAFRQYPSESATSVKISCKSLAAILHLIRWSTYLIGHTGILVWTQLVVRNCTRPSVGEGLAHKAMCGWVFDSGLTIQSMSGCLSHRGITFYQFQILHHTLSRTPIAYLNICTSCSSVTVTITLGVLWLVQSTSIRHLSCCFRACFVPEWHVPSLPLLQLKVSQLHHKMDSHNRTAKVWISMYCVCILCVQKIPLHFIGWPLILLSHGSTKVGSTSVSYPTSVKPGSTLLLSRVHPIFVVPCKYLVQYLVNVLTCVQIYVCMYHKQEGVLVCVF